MCVFFNKLVNLGLYWVFVGAHGLSLVAANRGYSLAAVGRLLIAVASLAEDHGLYSARASVVVMCGLISGHPALDGWHSSCGSWV